ncbi:MAG: hypothetical protein IKT33_01280 [Clostridia bacterium]|nr:hypothetical protein [Clostridia bacterium]
MKFKKSFTFLSLLTFTFFVASIFSVFGSAGNLTNAVFGANSDLSNANAGSSSNTPILIGCIVSGVLFLASICFIVIDSLKYKKRKNSGNVKNAKPLEVKKETKIQSPAKQVQQAVHNEVKPVVENKEHLNQIKQTNQLQQTTPQVVVKPSVEEDEDDGEYI